MKKVALVVDNSAAMSEQDLVKANVKAVVPISFIINGDEYYEGKNMTYSQFYDFLKDKNTNVSTCQPSGELVRETWREVLKENDEIVYVILSSGLSEACNTALNASHEEEFEGRVFVVNNQRVSYMNKMAMFEAAKLIEQGKSGKEVKDYLETTKGEVGAYIAVDTLKYLKKGGRLTPAAATLAALLRIKPVLQIQGEKLDTYAKVFNNAVAKSKMTAAIKKDCETRFAEFYNNNEIVIYVVHSHNLDNALKYKEEIQKVFPNVEILGPEELSLSVACHIGPGALALVATRKYVSKK